MLSFKLCNESSCTRSPLIAAARKALASEWLSSFHHEARAGCLCSCAHCLHKHVPIGAARTSGRRCRRRRCSATQRARRRCSCSCSRSAGRCGASVMVHQILTLMLLPQSAKRAAHVAHDAVTAAAGGGRCGTSSGRLARLSRCCVPAIRPVEHHTIGSQAAESSSLHSARREELSEQ